jgi:hypothetical protein
MYSLRSQVLVDELKRERRQEKHLSLNMMHWCIFSYNVLVSNEISRACKLDSRIYPQLQTLYDMLVWRLIFCEYHRG